MTRDKSTIKVCDFGMSAYNGSAKLRDGCGSPHYAAPEVCGHTPYNGCIADIWSCGVILYVMTFGLMPFDGDSLEELLERVKAGIFEFPEDPIPSSLRDLITQMLTVDPTRRITIAEIKEHPFFQSNHPVLRPVPEFDMESGEPLTQIDSNIMTTLCYLLNNVHITEVRENLFKKEPNTIRAFYRLLEQHRQESAEDPFVFTRSSPGPQSLKNTIFAMAESSPKNRGLSPAFSELANRSRATIPHIVTPCSSTTPLQINREDEISQSSSSLQFSMPHQMQWGLVGAKNPEISQTLQLACSASRVRDKLQKAYGELGIDAKRDGEVDVCRYKYMEDAEDGVVFSVGVKEGDIDDVTTAGFGVLDSTHVEINYIQGDVVTFQDVLQLLSKLLTDEEY